MNVFTAEDLFPENLNTLTVVDCWAPWCGPCRMVAPVLEQLSEEYEGKAVFGKLNVDDYPEAAMALGVMSIPTVIAFKDGKEVARVIGMQGKAAFKALIDRNL